MKPKTALPLILALFALASGPALATDKPNILVILADDLGYGELGVQEKDRVAARFKELDKNGDGKLSADELKDVPALQTRLKGADKDGDGFLTLTEVRAHLGSSNQPKPPTSPPAQGTPDSKPTPPSPAPRAGSADQLLPLLSKPAIDLLLVVSDLERAVKFYQDGVGMKPVGERTKLADGSFLQRLQWGQTVFHLVAPGTRPKAGPIVAGAGEDVKAQIIAANGLRLIYLLVDDKEGILARLKKQGITPAGGASAAGSYELFADPDGNPVAVQSTVSRFGGARRPQSLQMAHTVSDDAVARKFFGETLGLSAAGSIPLRSMGATEYRHAVGESVVKFWAPTVTKRESLGGPVMERLGARAVIFPVRDLGAVKRLLAAHGLKLLEEAVPALGDKPALVISDFDGNRILFLEQPVSGPAPTATPGSAGVTDIKAIFARYDKNKDGFITKDELANEQLFARLDANKDGKVTDEELKRGLGNRSGSSSQPRQETAEPPFVAKPRTPDSGGPLLFDGWPGPAAKAAAGETQLFEQVFIPGITDLTIPAQGCAVVDLNRDGRTDIVLTQKGGVIVVFLNQGNFEFRKHPLKIEGEISGDQAPTFADFNGDGFLDCYLSTVSSRKRASFLLSQGAWDRFKEVAVPMGVDNPRAYARGQVSVGDIDNDGWLDMAIAANAIGSGGATSGRPLSRLYLYRPSRDGVYEHGKFEDLGGTDVIPGFGGVDPDKPDSSKDVNGMSCVLRDLDGDGDLDLIRAAHNDMLRGDPLSPFATGECPYGVYVWRNMLKEEGKLRFKPIPPGPGSLAEHGKARWNRELGYYEHISSAIAGETILTADTDNDGDLEVLVTGVTGPSVMVHSLWTAARFWQNDGDFRFSDATKRAGLTPLNWYFDQWHNFWGTPIPPERRAGELLPRGSTPKPKAAQRVALKDHLLYFGNSAWGDFNNDGWLDLFQVTRWGGQGDGRGVWRSNLLLNRGNGTFEVVKTELSGVNEMGLAAFPCDLNNDGLLDVVLSRREEGAPVTPCMVFWNTGRQFGTKDNHWLRVALAGRPQRQLIGAKLYLEDETGKLLGRRDYTVDCMRGSHDADVHFGLGQRSRAQLRIELPDGTTHRFANLEADRTHRLDVAEKRSPAPAR